MFHIEENIKVIQIENQKFKTTIVCIVYTMSAEIFDSKSKSKSKFTQVKQSTG